MASAVRGVSWVSKHGFFEKKFLKHSLNFAINITENFQNIILPLATPGSGLCGRVYALHTLCSSL